MISTFYQAQKLWNDSERVEILVAIMPPEDRSAVIGMIDGKLWTAIVTKRGEATRIICVRRSRKGERRLYDI